MKTRNTLLNLVRNGSAVGLVFMLFECNCPPCNPTLVLELPKLGTRFAGSVTLEFRHEATESELFRCQTNAISEAELTWSCQTPLLALGEGNRFYVQGVDAAQEWRIRRMGTFGDAELFKPAELRGSTEGWPGQCYCDPYDLHLTYEDLGLEPPSVGSGGMGAGGMGGAF